MDRLKVR